MIKKHMKMLFTDNQRKLKQSVEIPSTYCHLPIKLAKM